MPPWMDGIMRSIDILEWCSEERGTYDQLEAAYALHGISQGGPRCAPFPSRAEMGEAADLLGLAGVEGWDHLVDCGSSPQTCGGETALTAGNQGCRPLKMGKILKENSRAEAADDRGTRLELDSLLAENELLEYRLKIWRALARR